MRSVLGVLGGQLGLERPAFFQKAAVFVPRRFQFRFAAASLYERDERQQQLAGGRLALAAHDFQRRPLLPASVGVGARFFQDVREQRREQRARQSRRGEQRDQQLCEVLRHIS